MAANKNKPGAARILYYSDSREFGGAESYLCDLVSGLEAGSFEPACIYLKSRRSAIFRSKLPGVKQYELTLPGLWVRLYGIVSRHMPDIIHLNMNVPFSCFYALFFLGLFKKGKVVATVHSTVAPRSRIPLVRGLKALLCRMLFPVVDRFICVSNSSKAEFCRNYGVSEDKVSVVYNGIRPFSARPINKSGGISAIGCAARLDRDKGIEYLLEAFSRLSSRRKDLKCYIAGEGEDKKRLVKLAASLGISDRVQFAGYVGDKDQIYSSMDIFVLPSLHETFSLAVLEAMHAGKPVVAAAVGGIPEVVDAGVTGILVPPKDIEALVRVVISLLEDPSRAYEMGDSGKKRCADNFSLDRMMQGTMDVYRTQAK